MIGRHFFQLVFDVNLAFFCINRSVEWPAVENAGRLFFVQLQSRTAFHLHPEALARR